MKISFKQSYKNLKYLNKNEEQNDKIKYINKYKFIHIDILS